MATATILQKLGPGDHGREITLEEFEWSDMDAGFKYELIDGRLYVSPAPDPPENILENWLKNELHYYAVEHPEVINYVSGRTRVFIPNRDKTTCPEPDVAAYADFPYHLPLRKLKWDMLHPVLVIEIMTRDIWKDLVRNTELYLLAPSIREYWVLDARKDPDQPLLVQHVRRGKRWVVREHRYGSTFTTRLLPGFSLTIDPRRRP